MRALRTILVAALSVVATSGPPVAGAATNASPPDLLAQAGAAPAADVAGAPAPADTADLLDLNRASLEQVRALPIPGAVAEAIVEYRTYVAFFTSIFDLLKVDGMTPELLVGVRTRVFITPVFESARQEQEEEERRAGELNYLVQRLLADEGANEGLVDEYVDALKVPRNINRLDYWDLTFCQNVSPVDAVAVLRERAGAGRIENARQLRAAGGLSYWGFRNLRDFVRYDDPAPRGPAKLNLGYQFRVYNTPYVLDDADILNENVVEASPARNYDLNTFAGRLNLYGSDPYLTNKLRLGVGDHVRFGVLAHRNLGETRWDETMKGYAALTDLPARRTPFGSLQLHQAVLGSFTAAFGEGLILDATDFFQARRTGYGYSVRPIGLHADISRSEEFALRGAGVEASLGALRGTFFYSRANKDAILNPADSSFNAYIRMVPRLSNEYMEAVRRDIASGVLSGGDARYYLPMRGVMDEQVRGGNLRLVVAPGASLGITGVQMTYENNLTTSPRAQRWNPTDTTLIARLDKTDARDSEINAGYNSMALGNYRRVWGGDAQAVWHNLAFGGEYAKLETSSDPSAWKRIMSSGPEAWTAHAYAQYENLTALALYRDYGLGYDNPYNRAFSENSRFGQTLLDGNAFYLNNPYWAELGRWTPSPKAERGWYFTTRYQVNRQLTLTGLEYDTWRRVADAADMQRLTVRAEYRPIYPLRLRIRESGSSRHADRPADIRNYRQWDTRLEMLANLSTFDQLRLLYSTSNVMFAARGRLSGPASGGDTQSDTTAQRGIAGRAIQGTFTHNFNPYASITVSAELYDGFLWNYEDNEFVVVDGKGFRNWFMVSSRLSDNLSWRLKWTTDHSLARTYVDIRNFGDLMPPTPDATNARGDFSSFRLQLDYSL